MERELQPNRWEAVRHRIVEVLPMEDAFGAALPRVLRRREACSARCIQG